LHQLANENWTRRWDGSDREILIGQAHSAADDLAFAASLEPLFRDPAIFVSTAVLS